MATTQGVTVAVGDVLRCDSDDWEGRVLSVDDPTEGTVTLLMNSGDVRSVAAADTHWNWWDPKAVPA